VKQRVIKPDSLLFELVKSATDVAGIFAPVRLSYRLSEIGSK
jgi:hypothetical protein